jgi:hypothetical protein
MSSLAATQADGYYIPPAYLESGAYKKKSLNQFNNSKGHNQYLTHSVARFELPFDGFCTACHAIVGKGTRFNAHKAHVGNYFTTKIYEFSTTCRACGECEFKIRTNPKERTFDYVMGIRKKVEEFDSAAAGTHGVIDTEFGNGILQYKNGKVEEGSEEGATTVDATNVLIASKNSLQLLEKNVAGHRKAQTEHEHMTSLLKLNSKMGDDADANASLRSVYRKDRKAKKRRLGEAVGLGLGRGIELKEGNEEDATLAKLTMETNTRRRSSRSSSSAHQVEADRFRDARRGSIFASKPISGHVKSKTSRNAATTTCAQPTAVGRSKQPTRMGQKQSQSTSVNPTALSSVGALATLSSWYASDGDSD